MIQRTAPETAARARTLYAQGVPVKAITAETGLTTRQIYYWLDREAGEARKPGRPSPSPTARRRRADLARPPGAASRRRIMGRLWKAAETQIGEIEARLRTLDTDAPEGTEPAKRDAEREARALAVLARVLRELTALEDAVKRARPAAKPDAAKPDAADLARDPDTFRRELARRLEHLRDSGDGEPLEG